MFDLNYLWVTVECPRCHYKDEMQLIDVKNEVVVFCHNCKTSIQLIDDSASVHSGISGINKALDDLFKNFSG